MIKTAQRLVVLFIACCSLAVFSQSAIADDVIRATLKNGLRVVIVKNSLAPVVTTEVNYLVGSNESPEGFPGMAHAQEHMMFRGSPGLSADQLSSLIASLGGEFNADTQQTVTQYFLTVPAADIDIALNIEAVRMRGVLDSDDLWKEERGAIEQEVAQDLSNPGYVFSTRLLQELYAGTPYAHDALGTRESFQKTTGAMLRKFYDTWYPPNNAILVIVGDVDSRAVLAKVRDLFETIPARPVPQHPAIRLQPIKPSAMGIDTDLPYGMAIVAYRLPGIDSPDFIAGQVLADVLDSRRGRLYNLVIEGKALSAGFDSDALPKAASGYASVSFPQGGDGPALVSAIKTIITGYVKDGVPPELVEAAKRHEISDAEFQKNSVPGLAALWSATLAIEGRGSPEEDIEAVKKITADDVNRVARQYLTPDRSISAVLTPKPSGAATSSREFKGPESFTPKQVKAVTVPAWAEKALTPPALSAQAQQPVDTTLPNGLRLIVQPSTTSATIGIYGQVKNNPLLQQPDGQEGVARLMESLFPYGTTSLDRIAFQQAMDDIGAELAAGTSFSLRVLADRFDRGVQLLADNLLRPAFPAQAFTIVQQETAQALKGEEESPSFRMHRALRSALFTGEDSALREATPATVSALKLDDIKAYYRGVFRPDMTTVVVIGRVTPEQARAAIEKYFGAWTASGPKPQTELPPVPLNKPSSTVVPDASRVQVEVQLAETIGVTREHPDFYALQLGNHVLSGAFYATRLYRDLREKAGLVYSVESILEIGKTRSLFGVLYACDPPNVSKARAVVEGDLRAMQTTLVTAHELQQTKALLIRQVPLSRSSMENIAADLLSLSLALDNLPLDEPQRAARRYLELTAVQVKDAFMKWIRPADFVQVTLGPAPQ
jgi:zinc protease